MMFHIAGYRYPAMFALFIHGKRRRRKCRIGESTDRDRDMRIVILCVVIHGGTAMRAKMKIHGIAVIRNPRVNPAFTANPHLRTRKPCLHTKYAAGAALASQTMTDRYPDRITAGRYLQFPATAGGVSDSHHRFPLKDAAPPCCTHQHTGMLTSSAVLPVSFCVYLHCRSADTALLPPVLFPPVSWLSESADILPLHTMNARNQYQNGVSK